MSRFVINVVFTLKPGMREAFLDLVRPNAAASVRDEPGCFRFDVMTTENPDEVLLYEIYTDASAFDAHLATPHFKIFKDGTRDLIASTQLWRARVEENVKP